MTTDAEKVRAAADYIEQVGLHKGHLFDHSSLGRAPYSWDVPLESGGGVANRVPCCTYGALIAFGAERGGFDLWAFLGHVGAEGGGIGAWNDAPERTADEVVSALRSFADTLDAQP